MKRTLQEAASELRRELGVRRRCYGRWIDDGKLTDVEAADRMERMEAALDIVDRAVLLAAASVPTPMPSVAATPATEGKTLVPLRRRTGETDNEWEARVELAQAQYDAGASPVLATTAQCTVV